MMSSSYVQLQKLFHIYLSLYIYILLKIFSHLVSHKLSVTQPTDIISFYVISNDKKYKKQNVNNCLIANVYIYLHKHTLKTLMLKSVITFISATVHVTLTEH